MKLSETFQEGLARMVYGKSHNPRAKENQTEEFLDGYLVGQLEDAATRRIEKLFSIVSEYERRGCPDTNPALADFKEWKRGYWAGRWASLEVSTEVESDSTDSR